MKYSEVNDLCHEDLIFCALKPYMQAAAIHVQGGAIIAATMRKNDIEQICFALSYVSEMRTPERITGRQIYEYNRIHNECDACSLAEAAHVFEAYGYIMERAAAFIHGEEFASMWGREWQEMRGEALAAFREAAGGEDAQNSIDAVEAEEYACTMPIEEFADIQAMQAEAQRIAQEYRTNRERTKRAQPEQAGAQPKGDAGIDPKTLEILKKQFFRAYAPVDMLQFAEMVVELTQQGDKGAQRAIFHVWRDSKNIRTLKEGGNIKPVIKWARFRDEIAAACGVHFKHRYKPNELQ